MPFMRRARRAAGKTTHRKNPPNKPSEAVRFERFFQLVEVMLVHIELFELLGGGNSNMFYFHPENWGYDPI